MRPRDDATAHDQPAASPSGLGGAVLPLVLLAAAMLAISWLVLNLAGLEGLTITIGAVAAGIVLAAASYRNLMIPVTMWLITLLGFRNLMMLYTPGLPDLSPERVLFVWIFSLFMFKLAMGERSHARWHWLDTLLVAHLLYLLISILIHESAGMNSWTRSYLMGYGAYFVGKYMISGRWGAIRFIFIFLLAMNLYFGVIAVAEYFKINALIWPKMILSPSTYAEWPGRSHGPFLQPAVFGIVMGMLLPIQLYFIRGAKEPIRRGLLFASIPLVAAGLYFTYTRGSWLAGIFGLLTVGLVSWRHYLPLVGRMIIVIVLLLAIGVVNPMQDRRFAERMGTEHTVTGRLGTLGRAYRIFQDNPLFGCGYFRYNEVKREYVGTIEVPVYGVIKRSQDIQGSIHDMYLGVIAEEGLVGAGLHLAIYMQVFFLFRRKYLLRHEGDPFASFMMPVIAGLMIGYFVGGLSIDYRYFSSMTGLFFLMAGLIAGYQPATQTRPQPAVNRPLQLIGRSELPRSG